MKWYKGFIIFFVIMVPVLEIISYYARSERDVVYDIVGVYEGEFDGNFGYYVFEASGQYCIYTSGTPSIIHDEGTYENQGNGIFTLESTMNHEHAVVCGNNIIYDFDMLNKDVYFANKTTKEIFYVNLPEKAAD